MDAKCTTNRSLLRFADEVKAQFAFLKDKGFRCMVSEPTLVQFKSSKWAINIYHDQQSYEIGLQIENMRGADSYYFSEILRLIHSEQAEKYRDYMAHTVEDVAEGVRKLSKCFQKYVTTDILNDREFFSRLKLQRKDCARNYALNTQLEQAHKKSESAWLEKDFRKVVQVLSPLKDHLDHTDLKKLEYAKKHSSILT